MADGDGGDGGGSDGGGSDGGGSDGGGGSSDGGGFGGGSDSSSGGFGGGSDSGSSGDSSSDGGGFGGSSAGSDSSSGGFGGTDSGSSDSGSSDGGVSSGVSGTSGSDGGIGTGSTDGSSSDSASASSGAGDTTGAPSVGADSSDDGDPASSLPGGSSVASSDAASGSADAAAASSDDDNAGSTSAASGDQAATDGVTATETSAPSTAGDGFTVSTTALGDVNTTMGGLVGDGQGLLSGLGSLNLSPSVFGGIGSPVASAAQDLTGGQLSALGSTFGLLGSVNDNIGLSNAAYQSVDQQVSASLGGVTDPVSTTSPYGSLPDASIFGTTPGLPTFANPTPDEATALNTLNAQDLAAPTSLADEQAMQDQLVAHEAAKTHVYTDTAGHPTVGIGFNLDRSGARDALSAVGADYDSVRAGTQDLTDAQVTQLAHTDTQHAVDVARNYFSGFDSLDPARQRALVDMSFNLDNKINQFTGLHQALVNGDYDAAANHISSSLFARQTGIRGTDLTNQMRNGGQ